MKRRKFRALDIVAKSLISSYASGSHLSFKQESLIDVDTARQYVPGDKRLDSRSSLRNSLVMSRTFNPEKAMSVVLTVDVSASQQPKLEVATMAALYLGYLADMCGDSVGLVAFADKVYDFVSPTGDVGGISSALERWYESDFYPSGSNLDVALRKTSEIAVSNTLVVLLSDFCYGFSDRTSGYIKNIALASGNSMIALILFDPREWLYESQPFSIDFLDAENGGRASLDMRRSDKRELELSKWRAELKLSLRRAGAEPIFIDIGEENCLLPLVRYLLRS